MGEALPQIGSGGDGRKHPGQIGAQLAQELDLEELQPAPLMSTANAVRSQAAKVNLDLPPTLDHSGLENSASSDSRLAGIAG